MVDQAPVTRWPDWDIRISTKFSWLNVSKYINAWVLMAIYGHLLIRVKPKHLISALLVCLKHWEYVHGGSLNYGVVIENDQIRVRSWRIVCMSFDSYYSWPWFKTCAKYPALDLHWENIKQRERFGKRWVDLRWSVSFWDSLYPI